MTQLLNIPDLLNFPLLNLIQGDVDRIEILVIIILLAEEVNEDTPMENCRVMCDSYNSIQCTEDMLKCLQDFDTQPCDDIYLSDLIVTYLLPAHFQSR